MATQQEIQDARLLSYFHLMSAKERDHYIDVARRKTVSRPIRRSNLTVVANCLPTDAIDTRLQG